MPSLVTRAAHASAVCCALAAIACGHSSPPPASPPPASHDDPPAGGVPQPKGPLSVEQARKYMLALINEDRRSMGLAPVTLDDGPAERAAQAHAEEMAANGYLGHWGLDGSVPESRMTKAGGADLVLENASCFTDEQHRSIDTHAPIDPKEIAHTESMFFHEQPPNDGHRKNILKPWHVRVAIGVAQPRATPTEIPVPCVAQEFLDDYGTYAPLPATAHVGDRIRVEGSLRAPAKPVGVGLARVDYPEPLTPDDANARRTYPIPQPYQMYWTPGFVTPIPVVVRGEHFSIEVPLSDHGRPGVYEVSVWAKLPETSDFQIVSLRTIRVDRE